MTLDDLKNRFNYHKPKDQATCDNHERIRNSCLSLACLIVENTPPTREQSLAITKLEEVMFWANAAIARNP